MDGISDTNTEERILPSIDVLADDVLSLRMDVKGIKQRFDRLEKDVKQRFDGVELDLKDIKETLQKMNDSN